MVEKIIKHLPISLFTLFFIKLFLGGTSELDAKVLTILGLLSGFVYLLDKIEIAYTKKLKENAEICEKVEENLKFMAEREQLLTKRVEDLSTKVSSLAISRMIK